MKEAYPETNSAEKTIAGKEDERQYAIPSTSKLNSLIRSIQPRIMMERIRAARKILIDSKLFSVWLFLLAMPTLGLVIQIGLFLFGKTCSPFPMWFSFFFFSVLSLFLHWKCLLKFWGLVFLGLFFTAYTFNYCMYTDAMVYHAPMQLLLREGWNPIFDSTIEKFCVLFPPSSLRVLHTLFLPKTIALCGALIAQSTGLWIAESFLGYMLLFLLFRTAFSFAGRIWKFNTLICFVFAFSISFLHVQTLLDGLKDFFVYSALMTVVFSLILFLQDRDFHDYLLAIVASVICITAKTTGLLDCCFLWFLFGLYSWKHKETYWGILAVALLVAWIGMCPLITSWIQYGSPFYPIMSFDPNIETMDITNDFVANADGEQMGYLARFVYGWISPALATKACALYYHKADFHPVFSVTEGVKNTILFNLLLCFSIVLLLLSKKNLVTVACLFILMTLLVCPLKYVGYARYFPQAKSIVPLAFFQFCSCPPKWLPNLICRGVRYVLYFVICILSVIHASSSFFSQTRNMITECKMQRLLASFQKNGEIFEIPNNSEKAFTIYHRVVCNNVKITLSQRALDFDHFEDKSTFPHFKQLFTVYWNSKDEYRLYKKPSNILKFLDVFIFIPHPLFYRKPDIPESFMPVKKSHNNLDQDA